MINNMVEWIKNSLMSEELTIETTLLRLVTSLILGAIVGMERQHRKQSAGFRTFAMITTGTTLMMLVSIRIGLEYGGDVGRIAAQVVSGIGFLGAGAIIQSGGNIRGMTTASSIWAMSAVGLGVGSGMYIEAVFGTMVILFILVNLEKFEKKTRIEWLPRTLVVEIEGIVVDNESILSILRKEDIESQQLGLVVDIAENCACISMHVYIKSETNYIDTLDKIRRIAGVKKVRLEI
ncbi:MAG: MgtC/SapB family protein [Bacteroidales bacterium]